MGLIKAGIQRTFVTISGEGKLRVQSKEGVQGAIKREGEDSEGVKFEKWELEYNKISGMITGVSLFPGKFGVNLLIDMKDEEEFTLSVQTDKQFGEDLLKRMPGVDLKKEVTFSPYSIESEDSKYTNRGVAVYQDGEIVKNAFWDGEAKKEINGLPPRPSNWNKMDNDDKKYHYGKCRKHTISFLEENILPEFNNGEVIETVDETTAKVEEIDVKDLFEDKK